MSESTIDQQFIEYVVKSLVSKPDAVIVERIIDEKVDMGENYEGSGNQNKPLASKIYRTENIEKNVFNINVSLTCNGSILGVVASLLYFIL